MLLYISSSFTPNEITDEDILQTRKDDLINQLSITRTLAYTYIKKDCFRCSFATFGICDYKQRNIPQIDHRFITNHN